jgi:hypothetical protein
VRCSIYHNSELALQFLESNRAIMSDPANAELFLQYLPGNPSGTPPGTVFVVLNPYGTEMFWNFTSLRTQMVYLDALLAVASASSYVDAFFLDDVDGFPTEHPTAPAALGIGAAEVAALRFATQSVGAAAISALTLAGKYTWQAFGSRDTSAPHAVGRGFVGVTPASCAAFMRTYCAVDYQGRPMLMHMDDAHANQTVAAFLITRPPYAYVGYSWESGDANYSSLFGLQVGWPTGLCAEGPANVFSRPWSLGVPRLDCSTFTAELPFAAMPGAQP